MVVNLWTVPLLLQVLGHSDYGLYQLIAGVVSMLAFINASMTVSTQRYMSVTLGERNLQKLGIIYNTSIALHIIIGLAIVVILEILTPFLLGGFLNIPPGREKATVWIYQFMIISTFFNIAVVPFDAVLNAYENMIVFAIISIIEVVCKLVLVFLLPLFNMDLLILYGGGWALITILGALAKYIYTRFKYPFLTPQRNQVNKESITEMMSFAGWNVYGALASVTRNQGIAILLNKFFGAIINASYGIANQINGLVSYFTATLQKSINPQLMQSLGAKDNERMLKLAFLSSKYSTLIVIMLNIPMIIEMPYILTLWLQKIPEYTIPFARLTLIIPIISQMTAGIVSAIQANGMIKQYQAIIGSILILNIPFSILALYLWKNPIVVYLVMITIECVCLIGRILFAIKLVNLDWKAFCKKIIIPLIAIIGICGLCIGEVAIHTDASLFIVIIEYIVNALLIGTFSWIMLLSKEEKNYFTNLLYTISQKNKKGHCHENK